MEREISYSYYSTASSQQPLYSVVSGKWVLSKDQSPPGRFGGVFVLGSGPDKTDYWVPSELRRDGPEPEPRRI